MVPILILVIPYAARSYSPEVTVERRRIKFRCSENSDFAKSKEFLLKIIEIIMANYSG